MSKQYLLQLVCLLFVFCGGSLTVAQELDLDEIDVFGDSAAADPAAPATQTDDVFSEGGDVFSEGDEASSSNDPMSKDPSQLTEEDLMALMNQGAALQEEAKWNDAIAVYSRILQNARFALVWRSSTASERQRRPTVQRWQPASVSRRVLSSLET